MQSTPLTAVFWIVIWQPSIAPMTPSRPHALWKMEVDTLFSKHVGQETNAQPRVDRRVSTQSMPWCADERDTLNLSEMSRRLFWVAMYHRNMNTFLAISRGAALGCGHFVGYPPLGTFEG